MDNQESTTWSTKPFISYDGGDGHGGAPAEVLVIKGAGTISKIIDKGRTANVWVKVEKLQYDIQGWINTDEQAYKIASEAYKSGDIIQFRSEIQRKPAEPRSKTMAELREVNGRPDMAMGKEHTRKLMVGFAPLGEDMVLTGQHLSLPARDPSGDALPASAETEMPHDAQFHADAGDIESKPWLGVNNDGSINTGSYAINAETTMYFVIRNKFPQANEEEVRIAASELLRAVDTMQVNIYHGVLKNPNRFYDSHLMGRKIVQDTITADHRVDDKETNEARPEFIDDKDKRHAWFKDIVKRAYSIWEWSVEDYKSTL